MLGVAEAPNLIDLDPLGVHAPHMGVVIGHAHLASVNQKLRDGVLASPRDPAYGTDGLALAKKVQDLGTVLGGELSHISLHVDLYA